MIRSRDLDDAKKCVERLNELMTFKRGLLQHGWGGDVDLSFGGYKVVLTSGQVGVREHLIAAIDAEEFYLLNKLQGFGVQLEDHDD